MNIFYLDSNPVLCAAMHVDSHVTKMRTEICQMLMSTIHKLNGHKIYEDIVSNYDWYVDYYRDYPRTIFEEDLFWFKSIDSRFTINHPYPYGIGYMYHPCTSWTSYSLSNFRWLIDLGYALCDEQYYRYETEYQSCREVLEWIVSKSISFNDVGITNIHLAMDDSCMEYGEDLWYKSMDEYTRDKAISSYRKYYKLYKTHLHKWSYREVPSFINN